MRDLPDRPDLPQSTKKRLAARTQTITDAADRRAAAKAAYKAARDAKWFTPIVDALKALAGPSGACMYCSCNEPSEIDHYRPISADPIVALWFENFVWACGVCNHRKRGRFPPVTEPGAQIVNPIDDSVWDHFFIDPEYGRLIPAWDANADDFDARGKSTCNIVEVDRQYVQDKRKARLDQMKAEAFALVERIADGMAEPTDVAAQVQAWLDHPQQPDVADYFLRGPGANHDPFAGILKAAKAGT
ncbi:MAG: HNH endonuclease [Armatimonadetes bacterium]|nr:HNH endonuclease [Armatimonadota bacterium]